MPDEIDPARRSDSVPAPELDGEGLSELDDATDLRVRELLAEARHEAPLPPAVALRLDEVLAGLVAESSPVSEPGTSEPGTRDEPTELAIPIDLDARRRRKRWTAGLVAAAAVVVLGVSVPTLLESGGSDSSESASTVAADDYAETGPESGDTATEEDAPSPGKSPTQEAPDGFAEGAPAAPAPSFEVDPDQFGSDALAARETPAYDALPRPALCGPGPLDAAVDGASSVVAIRYDEQSGYLVFLDPAGKTQRVELYLCPAGELERTVTLPAP